MIPAGPERDRLICKHKKVDYLHKPYSTDITAAMELWEEMVEKGAYYSLKIRKVSKRANVFRVRAMKENIQLHTSLDTEGISEAIADAISGAWLIWKEGE